MTWPHDSVVELEAFYGRVVLGANGKPTVGWEEDHLATFVAPYPLALSWDPSKTASRVTCHKLVAPSLKRILGQILTHFGNVAEVQKARMHLYGGCYEYRKISGSHRLSVHAFGVGIDLDPERNPRGVKYDPNRGMMPQAVIDIFAGEGWKWGGTFQTIPDCMHFQATH
jgi:hypothetical protein